LEGAPIDRYHRPSRRLVCLQGRELDVAALSGGIDFRIGRVLSRSFGVCGRHIIPFSLLCLLVALPNYVQRLFLAGGHPLTPHQSLLLLPLELSVVFTIPISLAIILLVVLQDLENKVVTIGGAARQAFRRLLPMLACLFCVTFAVCGGLILLVIPGIIVGIITSLSLQVCAAERLGPIASMSRSAALTKGNRWRIFGLLMVTSGITVAMELAAVPVQRHLGTAGAIIAYLASGVLAAYSYTVFSVQFYDLRVAKEGIGTERIAAVFD